MARGWLGRRTQDDLRDYLARETADLGDVASRGSIHRGEVVREGAYMLASHAWWQGYMLGRDDERDAPRPHPDPEEED